MVQSVLAKICYLYVRPSVIVEINHRDAESPSIFFFQAEDGIRDLIVTGVQTCALPISRCGRGVQGDADGTGCAQRRRRQPTDEQFASTPRVGRQDCWPVPDSRARRLRKVRKAVAPYGL